MPSFFDIIAHTPLWVWPLMAAVFWLGWYGRRERVVPPSRLWVLPLVGLGISLSTIMQSASPGLAAAGWLAAMLAALPLGYAIGRRREIRLLDDGRLQIVGGWFLLGFGLSIFAAHYALGVLFGVLPALKVEPLWIGLSGGVSGVIAGIGVGWLAGLLLRARRSALVDG